MADEKGGSVRFYKCSCFTTDNIFLEDYKLHVRFVSPQQFRQDYEQVSQVRNVSRYFRSNNTSHVFSCVVLCCSCYGGSAA